MAKGAARWPEAAISAATRCARSAMEVGHQHRRAVPRQALRDGFADPGAAAGDQRDLSREPHAASSSMAITRAGAPSLSGSLRGSATTRLRGARSAPVLRRYSNMITPRFSRW